MDEIEGCRHAGRGLLGGEDDDGAIPGWPELAYESIRAVNHITGHGAAIAAPTLYRVLGELKGVGYLLPQALTQLGEGLQRSLETLPVYDHERDPEVSVALAREHLAAAATAPTSSGHSWSKPRARSPTRATTRTGPVRDPAAVDPERTVAPKNAPLAGDARSSWARAARARWPRRPGTTRRAGPSYDGSSLGEAESDGQPLDDLRDVVGAVGALRL